MYFDYPLEQGLRQYSYRLTCPEYLTYFDYPLEQGLRRHQMQLHHPPGRVF